MAEDHTALAAYGWTSFGLMGDLEVGCGGWI